MPPQKPPKGSKGSKGKGKGKSGKAERPLFLEFEELVVEIEKYETELWNNKAKADTFIENMNDTQKEYIFLYFQN